MPSKVFETLTEEGKELVRILYDQFTPRYNEEVGAIVMNRPGPRRMGSSSIPARPNLYYALALLLLDKENCGAKAEKICRYVMEGQVNAPDEIFHGTYNHTPEGLPRAGVMDYKRLGTYGRYFTDLFYEKVANQFRLNLKADERFRDNALEIEHLLEEAVVSEFPVVWTTYEPNSREFVVMCLAMLLEHFADHFSDDCVLRMEQSAIAAIEGSIIRDQTDFSPLNTNVECMYVFITDYFGKRLERPEWCQIALNRAEKMLEKYRQYHSVAEFNSPSYYPVDLGVLGFWQRYGSNKRIREISAELETGIWEDWMEFYNPAMQNVNGPFTRGGSAFSYPCAIMYLGLGKELYPIAEQDKPTMYTSECPLVVLGKVEAPESAKRMARQPKEDVTLYHQFRELAERGEPGANDALCTATGWITPDLMLGALSGSKNPSHQLNPFTAVWRGREGLGSIRVQRSTPEGKLNHLHYVIFDAKAEKNRVSVDVDFQVNRDVKLYFEIEYPGICREAQITDTLWKLPGLEVKVLSDAPKCFVEKPVKVWGKADPNNILRVCFLSEALKSETKKMHFELELTRT